MNEKSPLVINGIKFSPRETEILPFVASGMSYKTIAIQLGISFRTVDTHIQNIGKKIGHTSQEGIRKFLRTSNVCFDTYSSHKENKLTRIIVGILLPLLLIMSYYVFFMVNANKHNTINNIKTVCSILERQNILDKMLVCIKQNKTIVLIGQGGMGKTTIARKFAVFWEKEYDFVFEINAETADAAASSFKNIAWKLASTEAARATVLSILNISDREERTNQIIDFVKKQLIDHKWLLIFDNVNDVEIVKKYFIAKNCGIGNIIVTTRNAIVCNSAYLHNAVCLKIPELTKKEKQKLFCGILERDTTNAFLEAIPSYPLDISTAAYYIKNTAISYDDYLERLKDIDNLEKEERNIIASSSDYKQTRYTIISSVFSKIISENENFKVLALTLCLIDSQNIPRSLLERVSDKMIVDAFICSLLKHSIISVDGSMTNIHRFTQAIGRKFLLKTLSSAEKEKYIQQLVDSITPYSEIRWLMYRSNINSYNTKWFMYLPHYNAIVQNIENASVSQDCKDRTLVKILIANGFILAGSGENIDECHTLYKKALAIDKDGKYINDYEKAVITFEFGFGALLRSRYDEAILQTQQVLLQCDKIPESEALRVIAIAHLGRIYSFMNNIKNAKDYLAKAWSSIPNNKTNWSKNLKSQVLYQLSQLYTNSYKKNDIERAIACSNQILTIWNAEKYFHKSSEGQFEQLAFFVPVTRCNLIKMYNSIGKYAEALQEADEIEYLYKEDPDNTIFGIYLQASIEKGHALMRMEKTNEAKQCLNFAIDSLIKMGGDLYFWVAYVYRSELFIRDKAYDLAYQDCEQALKWKTGNDNYSQLLCCICLFNGAITTHQLNKITESTQYIKQFLELANNLCVNLLNDRTYRVLKENNVFVLPERIDIFLENSRKIFSAICGQSHPFVNYLNGLVPLVIPQHPQ
jgi:DNA-binding CsgD family transcriptional regulator/tetratricopeptide (TPR) repeat protein